MVVIIETSIVEKEIDALIKRGWYTNRGEFVEDAIRTFFEFRRDEEGFNR